MEKPLKQQLRGRISVLLKQKTEHEINLLLKLIFETAPRVSRKALFIAIMIIVINECCGAFILVSYSATIFSISGSVLSPNLSSIVVGLIQLIGTYISTMFIDKAGRKVSFVTSRRYAMF